MVDNSSKESASKGAASNLRVPSENSQIRNRADRLRLAIQEAGGNSMVSTRSGVPLSTLNGYLAGRDMKVQALVDLARAMDVSIEWLATGCGSMRREQPHQVSDEELSVIADKAMKANLPPNMSEDDKDDLIKVTLLAQMVLAQGTNSYPPDQLVILAANYFGAMRELPGTRSEQYREFSSQLYRDYPNLGHPSAKQGTSLSGAPESMEEKSK